MSLLTVQNLACAFSGKRIFSGVSFTVQRGEFIGIAGLNGSGKTTLLKAVQRLISPDMGTIFLQGRTLESYSSSALARRIAVVPQRITISFEFTAYEMALLGRTPYLGFLSRPSERDHAIVEDSMRKTDCWKFADCSVSTLSSGEMQRVCIATALAQEPELLLLDEPTNALDVRQQNRLLRLLNSLKTEGKTILFATHDLTILQRMADRVLLLHANTRHAFDVPQNALNRDTLREIFEFDSEAHYVR